MASWSMHSYRAPRVETAVEDSPSDTRYPAIGQPIREQPTEDIAPQGKPAPNAMEFMPNAVLPPRMGPAIVDRLSMQDIQLPSSAEMQRSLGLPIVPPPTFMEHLHSGKSLPSGFMSEINPNTHHSMNTPGSNLTSISNFEPNSDSITGTGPHHGSKFESKSDFDSDIASDSGLECGSGYKYESSPGLYQSMFNYWVSEVRPRRYVTLLFCDPSGLPLFYLGYSC